ncbi:MAG TPA: hypothetical protein VK927_08970, partial [Adhaeribacter sp.]|nr:hypothetical protein [Adhaeribacter sp.]
MRAITLILGASLWLLHSAVIGQPSRSNFVNRLLFSPSENPDQPASRMAGISSKPGNSQQFSWPNNTTGWQHYANSTYLYTSDGRLMQSTTVSVGNGQPTEQLNYTYNGANLAEKVRKIWRNNAWENDTRDVYVYDAANKLQELRYESWYNGAWTTDDGIRYLRTYNATGQLTSETMQTWVLTWENAVRETYTLGQANTWTEVLVETWNQNSWQPVERITNLVWHNWSKRELQSYLLKTFAQNTWADAENATFSYSLTQ